MKVLTVNDLLSFCKEAVANGDGNKQILISSDDEGNGYHGLFYAFTPIDKVFDGSPYDPQCYLSNVKNNTHIILG